MLTPPVTWSSFVFLGMTLAATVPRLHLPNYLSQWHRNRLAVLRSLRAELTLPEGVRVA